MNDTYIDHAFSSPPGGSGAAEPGGGGPCGRGEEHPHRAPAVETGVLFFLKNLF